MEGPQCEPSIYYLFLIQGIKEAWMEFLSERWDGGGRFRPHTCKQGSTLALYVVILSGFILHCPLKLNCLELRYPLILKHLIVR